MLSEIKTYLTNAHTAILHESFIAGAYERTKGICTGRVFWTGSINLTLIYICGQLRMNRYGGYGTWHNETLWNSTNSAETHVPYNRGNVSEMKHHFLPMHTLPFFTNPSLQVHTKEPKVITKESELHHSIGSPIDGAHPGPKTDRDYLGRYCP